MPCRYIREDYLTSEHVDELDVHAERFYFRLFLVVDDFGRFEADEVLLRSKCYPRKDNIRTTDITRFLADCKGADLICLYAASGKRYLEILRFRQTRANCRSAKSKYPAPPPDANKLFADANNLQAFASENENENENENECHARDPKKSELCITKYPESIEDVLEICAKLNISWTQQDAQAYFDYRVTREWMVQIGKTVVPMKPERVPNDIRSWDRGNRERETRNASGGRVPDQQPEETQDMPKYRG